jgi:1,6-anhydro-N-acetylmuramate kinase
MLLGSQGSACGAAGVSCWGQTPQVSPQNAYPPPSTVQLAPVEAIGCDGDSLEAEAWAYLAVRSRRNLPISWPTTTGAPHALTGGLLAAKPNGSAKAGWPMALACSADHPNGCHSLAHR